MFGWIYDYFINTWVFPVVVLVGLTVIAAIWLKPKKNKQKKQQKKKQK